MKYYYEKPGQWVGAGEVYICDHPMYHRCTLFRSGDKALAIVQERYDKQTKMRWWAPIDPWIAGDIFLNKDFQIWFDSHAGIKDENDLYPTITVRQAMWELRMKPLKREYWENGI